MTVKEVVLQNFGKYHNPFIKLHTNDYRQFNGRTEDFIKKYSGTDVWNEHAACHAISSGKSTVEIWL